MFIRYGDLDFECERVFRFDHRAVFDETGQDFLYNHIVIGVQAVWHARATRANEVVGFPVADGAGFSPGTSIALLRTYMMQPRRRLQVRHGTEVTLDSPANKPGTDEYFPCDAKGGPQPISFNVIACHGDGRTMVCAFEIETWINDYNHATKTPAILSNRWTITEDIDELHYTTRYVQGTAVFRLDYLLGHPTQLTPLYCDDFRDRLLFPIPNGFQRQSVKAVARADQVTYDWSFVDKEVTLNLGRNNPALRVQGSVQSGWNSPSIMSLTTRWYGITFQAWGRRTTTRQQLINACARAAAAFGFNDVLLSPTLYYQVNWNVDVVNKHASLTVAVNTSGAFDTIFTLLFRDHHNVLLNFPEDLQGVGSVTPTQNPRPPFGEGTRGNVIARMITQALSDPSTVPPRPVYPGPVVPYRLYGVGGY